MSLAAYIYVDHQDVIGFPLQEVTASVGDFVDSLFIVAATPEQLELAHREVADPIDDVIVSGIRIVEPGDIPRTMTFCVEDSRRRGHDYCLLVQADTAATPQSLAAVRRWARDRPTKAVHLAARIGKLSLDYGSGWGHTLVPAVADVRFHGDGLGEGCDDPSKWVDQPEAWCLELGYLSIPQFARHNRQHAKTWAASGWWLPEWVELAERDPRRLLVEQYGKRKATGLPLQHIASVHAGFVPYLDKFVSDEERRLVEDVLTELT